MVYFAEINQASCSYSMFQHTGRVATTNKLLKLSQILANNIDNVGRVIGLRIYVRYCRSASLGVRFTLGTAIYRKLKSTI